jgi:hypothetical protein
MMRLHLFNELFMRKTVARAEGQRPRSLFQIQPDRSTKLLYFLFAGTATQPGRALEGHPAT